MLSGISFTDRAALEQEHRKEKSKKKKKEKKHKKAKHSKTRQESGDESDPASPMSGGRSGSEDEQAHGNNARAASSGAPMEPAAPAVEREAWMTVPMASSIAKPVVAQATDEDNDKQAPKEPIEHIGLRIMNPTQAAGTAAVAAEAARPSGPMVGDGGASWRLKALKRAQQAARDSGQNVAAVVAERWGSAAALTASLTQGQAAPDKAHLQAARRRAEQASGKDGSNGSGADAKPAAATAHYLSDLRSDRPQMMRPTTAANVSWRRGGGSNDRGGTSNADRGRHGDEHRDMRGEAEDKQHDRRSYDDRNGSERGAGSSGRGGAGASGYARGGKGGRTPEEAAARRRSRSPPHNHERQHDADRRGAEHRGGGRGDGREDSRDSHRSEASTHTRRDESRRPEGAVKAGNGSTHARNDLRQERAAGQRHCGRREADAAVLEMAGALNTFTDDGSFMQRFHKEQQQQQPGDSSPPLNAESDREATEGKDNGRLSKSASPMSELEGPSSTGRAAQAADGSRASLTVPPQDGNQGMAALLRARLSSGAAAVGSGAPAGNKDIAAALRAKLGGKPPAAGSEGRSGVAGSAEEARASGRKEVVVLPQVDASGRAAPGAFGREAGGDARRSQEVAAGGRVAKRVQRYGADGSKERYFADDDNVDLQTLVKRAKYGDDAGDMDATLARNIAARERFKATDLDVDDEYDHDAGLELYESRRKRGDAQQQAKRERERQISDYRRVAAREDACTHCFASAKRPRALTIAVGQSTYLALVQKGRLTDGHCCIMPAEHVGSMRQVDDATWTEVRNFQKCLIQMFMAQGKEVLFLETATHLQRRHAIMEAIPLSPDEMGKAPLYFKKAMQEAESEWSQHAAKAVIETKTKGLRGSVPPNFPYLYAQFGYANGYVHVIDDERKFDANLGRQVAVGLLRLPPEAMHQRSRADAPAVVAAAATDFRKAFAKYDWTAQLA